MAENEKVTVKDVKAMTPEELRALLDELKQKKAAVKK